MTGRSVGSSGWLGGANLMCLGIYATLRPVTIRSCGVEMGRQLVIMLYVATMVAVIVGTDLTFFKGQFWARLLVNIGIVAVFAAFYLRFFGWR
jgi:hypothetical protein